MKNYKEVSLFGSSYVRSPRAILDNPYGDLPRILFEEEIRTTLSDGSIITRPAPGPWPSVTYSPDFSFPLIDPSTGLEMQQKATLDQLEVMMYSLYIYLSTQRDALQGQ